MIYFLVNGAGLGLAAGLSPGPLMTLILAESLRGGWPAGFRVALAPLVTDTTLILIALLVAAPLPPWAVSVISVIGGGIIIWMGWGTARSDVPASEPSAASEPVASGRGALMKGITTNLLNPQAFIFWLTVGGPILKDTVAAAGWTGPLLFMAPFFVIMIGVNLVIALAVSRGRHLLQGAGYRWALRGAGLMLALLGAWRIWVGVEGLIAL